MTSSHILVQSFDSIGPRHLPVLLVHVVGAGAGIIANPDTEVLDFLGAFLVDLDCRLRQQTLSTKEKKYDLTSFKLTISPFAFLTFRSFIRKYQNLDLATTVFGAKMRMR